ncbi:MAG: alpha/beta fold hydrolase [Acidimicrobiales bacterium]
MSPASLVTEHLATAVGKVSLTRGGAAGGPPLVYLHSSGGEAGDTSAAPFLEAVGDRFEVFAPMLPGFAGSEGLDQIDDIEDAAYHCIDVFERLGLTGARTPHVVGLSLGGWVAAEIAWRAPTSLASVTLVSAVGIYVPGHPMAELFGRRFNELAEMTFADQSHPVAAMMNHLASVSIADSSAVPFDVIRPFFESMAAAAKLGWNPYFHNPKLPRRLGRVKAPTLVLCGRLDGLVPNAVAEEYSRLVPGARLEAWDDASHMIPLEQPDRLAALVAEHALGAEPGISRRR